MQLIIIEINASKLAKSYKQSKERSKVIGPAYVEHSVALLDNS